MAPSHQHSHPQILLDALYCPEEFRDTGNSTAYANCSIECRGERNSSEDEYLRYLLRKEEQETEPYGSFTENPSRDTARGEAVEWVLKVVDYFSFSALTAVLAVNYLDRFMYRFEPRGEGKPWVTQLAAVACLSLAAKVEETQVPLLIDLQVEDSKYLFESKTIQRMEILVLSTLEWKMNPVTPLAFLECIATRLDFKAHFCDEIIRRCECLVLSVVSDHRFARCSPSALATSAMVFVISSLDPCICVEFQDQLKGILGINQDKVEDCCRLIQEVATGFDFCSSNKRKFGSMMPRSPKGVVDISFSSDDSWELSPIASISSSPVATMQPLSKKIKSSQEESTERVQFSDMI